MFRKILVPLDGSAMAEQVFPLVQELAWKFDGQVTLLRVVAPISPSLAAETGAEWFLQQREIARQAAEEYLRVKQGELQAQNIPTQFVVLEGNVPEMILSFAEQEGFDLIAMVTHGRSGISRWALGSVAEKVVRGSHCPVLLVRGRQPRVA